jgi:hypothetical protein
MGCLMSNKTKTLVKQIIDDLDDLSLWSYDYLLSTELSNWADEILDIIGVFNTELTDAHSSKQIQTAIKEYDSEELIDYYSYNDIPRKSGNYEPYQEYIKRHKAKDTEQLSEIISHNDYLCDKLIYSLDKLISTISGTKYTKQLNA